MIGLLNNKKLAGRYFLLKRYSYLCRNIFGPELLTMRFPTGPHVNTCFYSVNGLQIWIQDKEILTLSPYDNFMYALNAKTTKRQYPNRLDKFLSFIGLEGSIQEKCSGLYEISKNKDILYLHLIRFINSQKVRIQNKEMNSSKR